MFAEPILHVDMDAFFVEVERRRDPALRHRPVVVGGAGPRGVVAAASYEARRFGIASAMPMVAARRRCPQLTIVPPDHRLYQEVSAEVFEIFRSVTPLVEGLSLDEAFLDVSGLRLHHPDPVAVGHLVRHRVRTELDLPASVGVAATKFVAKLASASAKPDGLLHVAAADTLAFLHGLPVRFLWGVGEATRASLEAMGVATVGDLANLPEQALIQRLGFSHGRQLSALARGEDPRPVVADQHGKSISVEETYGRDLESAAEVHTELLRLCDRLTGRLRRAGLAGRTVGVTVRYGDFSSITRHRTFSDPVSSLHDLRRAVEALRHSVEWGRPVRLLGLSITALVDRNQPRQLTVDGEPRWDDLATAIDAVQDRFGHAAVRPARLLDLSREPKTGPEETGPK
ncbi:MAG TPA: DNA polymerase IV [Acidimicrobiia bacterium]|nr:DNA polymerase IV [Acidimicrobiia bacterium]